MSYEVHLSSFAKEGLAKLKQNEPKSFDKVLTVLVLSSYGHYGDK